MIPNQITVLIDSRERQPLLFPSWIEWHGDRTLEARQIQVLAKVVTLPAGDYTLEGYEGICIIETKRSLRELFNNVCTEWPRAAKALHRLSKACKYPYVVWEMSCSDLMRKSKHVQDPPLAIDRWLQACTRLNLRLMWVGSHSQPGPRRKLGEQLVRLMLAHIETEEAENALS
jgi:hypothetical protein